MKKAWQKNVDRRACEWECEECGGGRRKIKRTRNQNTSARSHEKPEREQMRKVNHKKRR